MRRFDFVVTCVCCSLLGYFAWHAWKGPRGYPHQEALQQRVAILQAKFEQKQQARVRLEHRVGLLRPESVDPDLLDELARGRLQMTSPTDVMALIER